MPLVYLFGALLSVAFIPDIVGWANTTLMNLTGTDIKEIVLTSIGSFFDFIFNAFMSVFNNLVGLLPYSDGLPAQVIYAANEVTPFMNVVNMFFPFDTVLYLISILMAIQMTLWSWSIGLKLYGWARGTDIDTSGFNMFASTPEHASYAHYNDMARVQERINRVKVTRNR